MSAIAPAQKKKKWYLVQFNFTKYNVSNVHIDVYKSWNCVGAMRKKNAYLKKNMLKNSYSLKQKCLKKIRISVIEFSGLTNPSLIFSNLMKKCMLDVPQGTFTEMVCRCRSKQGLFDKILKDMTIKCKY